jgi:type II secretory pathway pseudopilin PulG
MSMTMSTTIPHRPRAFTLVGLLIVMVCIVVLFAVLMTALNKAVTGQGSAQMNTLRSAKDKLNLYALMQAMVVYANDHEGWYPVPSQIDGSGDRSRDTTANLFSAMVALRLVKPENLIAGNEYSGFVEQMWDYDFLSISPAEGRFWDPSFKANLKSLSHVSYAHQPLYGERAEQYWQQTFSGTRPLIGNRGPKDGVDDPSSLTYGRNGVWGGHLVYGDGHVDFVQTFTPSGSVYERDGQMYPDNVFAMEDGPDGRDAILAFTSEMTPSGPTLQWD